MEQAHRTEGNTPQPVFLVGCFLKLLETEIEGGDSFPQESLLAAGMSFEKEGRAAGGENADGISHGEILRAGELVDWLKYAK
jgi:hypothetical protein